MSIKRAEGGGVSLAELARQEAARRAAEAAARRAAMEAAAEAARKAAEEAAKQQSRFEPAPKNLVELKETRAPATSLFTENARDRKVNCLDLAADFVSHSSPQLQARSELVFLEDTRGGAEGQSGHVVVRQGERVFDPTSGKSYEDMQGFQREQPHYREVGTLPGTSAARIFATEPGSPERAQALADAKVSPALQRMMVADQAVPDDVPNPATAEPREVNYPLQAGPVSVEFSDTLDKDVKEEDGYVTVTLEAETSVSASGSVELNKVRVGGSVSVGASAGETMTYEVRMKKEDFERLKAGEIPPPHPLDPSTLPDGGSVRLEQSQFIGTSMEVGITYHLAELGMGSDIREGEGMMLEMSRTGDKVQVTAGPSEFIQNDGKVSFGVGPVSIYGGRSDTLTSYQLRTAEFDLSKPEGQEAFAAFRESGRLPEEEGPGVANTVRLEKVSYESSGEVGIEIGPLDLSTSTGTNTGDMLITHHPDGTKSRTLTAVYGDDNPDLTVEQRFDKDGKLIPGSEKYALQFDTTDPNMREILVMAYTGDEEKAKAARESDEPIVLNFTPEQMRELQERANEGDFAHMGLGGLLSDYDGEPLEPFMAARNLAGSIHNEYAIVEKLWSVYLQGGREGEPLPGELTFG